MCRDLWKDPVVMRAWGRDTELTQSLSVLIICGSRSDRARMQIVVPWTNLDDVVGHQCKSRFPVLMLIARV